MVVREGDCKPKHTGNNLCRFFFSGEKKKRGERISQILKARENKTELFSRERNHTWHQLQFCLVEKALGRTEIMPVGLVVSFFNQINHVLLENKFCLLMA